MGTPSTFTSMAGYISRLKEEADRREEEERRKKEEEERRRREEEARRQSIQYWRREVPIGPPTKEQALPQVEKPLSRPNISLSQVEQPSFEVGPTSPRPNTQTPEIQSSMVTGIGNPEDTSRTQQESNTVQSRVKPPQIPSVQYPSQRPGQFPTMLGQQWNPPIPPVAPPNTLSAAPLAPYVLPTLAKPIYDMYGNLVENFGNAVKKAAPVIASAASLIPGLPQAAAKYFVDVKQGPEIQKGITQAIIDYELPATPGGQVLDRFKYNMFEKPQDDADRLLQKFAPAAYVALKGLEGIGAVGELFLTSPLPFTDYTLGEMWSLGARAYTTYNLQHRADLIEKGWTMEGNIWTPPKTPVTTEQGKKLVAADQAYSNASKALGIDFGGLGQNYQVPPDTITDLWSAFALAEKDYAAALAPAALAASTANPTEIARWIANARSMAHHGIAAAGQQMEDLVMIPQLIEEKATAAWEAYNKAAVTANPEEREKLFFEAASLGWEAAKLKNTHPAQLFDQNANWWMAVPAEFIFDPLNFASVFFDLVGLAPKARRMMQGTKLATLSTDKAIEAIETGRGIGKTVDDFITESKLFWQNNTSKAMVDARNNWRTLTSLFQGFTTREDFRTIIVKYGTDALGLARDGIPASDLTSPIVRISFPDSGNGPMLGPGVDVVKFGTSAMADYNAIKSSPSLQYLLETIDTIPSLMGEGPINPAEVAADLYLALTRAGGERFGVAVLPGVPVGTKKVAYTLDGTGSAILQYLGERGKVISESAPMLVAEASKRVKDFNKFLASGQELSSNFVEQVGNVQRSILSAFTLDASASALINNAMSNRTVAIADGVWSWMGKDAALQYIQNVTGGVIPYDEIASMLATEMRTGGSQASMFSNTLSKLPGVKQLRDIRVMDEKNTKAIVYARVHRESMQNSFLSVFVPAMTDFLTARGWTDGKEIKAIVNTIFDAGISRGRAGMLQEFYNVANGNLATSVSAISPNYREVYGQYAAQLDTLIRSVLPDNLQQTIAELDNLSAQALADLSTRTNDYVFQPGRTYYTRLTQQAEVADMQSALTTIARALGEDDATGVTPFLNEIVDIQREINSGVMQLVQMASQSPNSAGHIYDLWDQITLLRENTKTSLDRLAEALFGRNGIPAGGVPFGPQPDLMKHWREQQSLMHKELGEQSKLLVETFRTMIATGAPYTGPNPLLNALTKIGHDANVVFEVNKTIPGVFSQDPNRASAIKAGRAGADAFITQMLMLLQKNPTESGFDNFLSAMDDATRYYQAYIATSVRNATNTLASAQAVYARYKEAKAAGAAWDVRKGLYGRARSLYKQYAKENTDAWNKYYEFAYARYQAGAVLIAQNAGGVVDLPTFVPLYNWANGQTVKLMGQSPRNPKVWMVQIGQGNELVAMPQLHMPPDILEQWKTIAKTMDKNIAEQIGKMSMQLFSQGTGAADIDALIARIRNATKNPVLDAVRADIARYTANPTAYGELGSDLSRWYAREIERNTEAIKLALSNVAQRNARPGQRLSLNDVKVFSETIAPIWDNMLTGAGRAAERMVSFSLVDFINKYGGDTMVGALVPYAYWASRQGKNMLERMLFNPRFFGYVAEASKILQSEARKDGMPQRYNESINTGIRLPNGEDWQIGNPIPNWAPFGVRYIFKGWGDYDRASQGMEVLLNQMETSGFPGISGVAGGLMAASEGMSAAGLPQYPWIRAGILAANDRSGEIDLSMFGFLGTLAGLISAGVTGQHVPFLNRFYEPYITSRDVSNAGFGVDDSGLPLFAAGQADYEGRTPAPEFLTSNPNALAEWTQQHKEQSLETLFFTLMRGLTSLSSSSMDPNEPARLAAQQKYAGMGWSPENPTGGRARLQMLDETSPNYVPGLATGQAAYQVIGEGPQRDKITPSPDRWPYLPTYETRRLDEGVVLGEYLDKRKEIGERYKATKEAEIAAHPEWSTQISNEERRAFEETHFDALQAEYDALDKEYPTVAGKFKDPTAASLRGANPIETTEAALDRLLRQAQEENAALKPGDYPENGERSEVAAWYDAKAIYDEAVRVRITALMADPQAASDSVFGRPLNMDGPMPGGPRPNVGPSMSPVAPTTTQPAAAAATAPVQPVTTTDPRNQWAQQMTAAEQEFGLPGGMLEALARKESNFNPAPDNGYGMMQMEDAAWNQAAEALGVTDRENPDEAIRAAAFYLNWVNENLSPDKKGNPMWIAAGYNMGVTAVNGMTSEQDIKNYDKYGGQRLSYVQEIATASSGQQPVAPSSTGVGMPFSGSHPQTQSFGVNPERYKSWGGHMGLDYSMPIGTELMATQEGTVIATGNSPKGGTPSQPGTGGFGNWIIVQYPNGYTAEYAHLSEIKVKPGEKVTSGQVIGLSGHTGVSDFPHLHFGVRKDGEYIDPTSYLTMQATAMPATVAPTSAGSDHAPPPATVAQQPTGGVKWGTTPEQLLENEANKYKGPNEIAQEKAVAGLRADQLKRVNDTYPKYAHLFEDYKRINDADREAWRQANPMIRALNMIAYNPDEWTYVEKTFGKGVVEKWAALPPTVYQGGAEDDRGNYYRQYPDVFLAKAWIDGRPRPYEEKEFDPTQPYVRNFGSDYETAKEMFGENIWDVVREYYTTPKFVKGGDNAAWIAFKEKYPQYDEWRAWWYGLVDDGSTTSKTFQPWGSGGFGGSFGGFGDPNMGEHPQYIKGVEFQRGNIPEWRGGSGANSDWRKYLALGEVKLRNWNR